MDVTSLQSELQQLRQDNEQLRQQLSQTQSDLTALVDSTTAVVQERNALREQVAGLKATNHKLLDMLWGRRSERRVSSAEEQLLLPTFDSADDEKDDDAATLVAELPSLEILDQELIERLRKKLQAERQKRGSREQFPEHLPRHEQVIDFSHEMKKGLVHIGDDVTERLFYELSRAYVLRIIRRKYVPLTPGEQQVLSPPASEAIVAGCKYDFSVIAAVLTAKFAFHQPTYRQQNIFGQLGWFPSRSTLNDLVNLSVTTLEPLFQQMCRELFRQTIVMTDDTRIRLLTREGLTEEQQEQLASRIRGKEASDEEVDPVVEKSGSVTSYAWVYAGLDDSAPYQVFYWSLMRTHAVVDAHLATYTGTIVGDAYDGYTSIAQRTAGRVNHSGCNTHARRGFTDAESEEPILSARAISFYAQLYAIEDRGKTLSVEERLQLRQREATRVWDHFESWLRNTAAAEGLPQGQFSKAVHYILNHLESLKRYLTDGRIPMDNNQSESAIRPLAVGRKNWLFLGHPAAAAGRLQLMSIVSSAERHHLVVHNYLQDVLKRMSHAHQHAPELLTADSDFLRGLLPDQWAKAHPESMLVGRQQERETLADRTRLRRAEARQQSREEARQARSVATA